MRILIIIFLLTISKAIAQEKQEIHNLDSCTKCKCTKYHRTVSKDSLTDEKIVRLFKQWGIRCRCNVTDGYCKYKSITTQYYANGQIHIKKILKGDGGGWQRDEKTKEIDYETKGKVIKVHRTNNAVDGLYNKKYKMIYFYVFGWLRGRYESKDNCLVQIRYAFGFDYINKAADTFTNGEERRWRRHNKRVENKLKHRWG